MPETTPQVNPQMLPSLGAGGGTPPTAPGPAGPAGLTPEILQMILPILIQILQSNPQLLTSLMGAGGAPAGGPPMPMPGAGPGEGGESELLAALGIPGKATGGAIPRGQSAQVGQEIVTAQPGGGATVTPSKLLTDAIFNNRTHQQMFAQQNKAAPNPTQAGAPNAAQAGPTKEQMQLERDKLLHNSIPPDMLKQILDTVARRPQVPQPPRVPQTPGAPGTPNLFQKQMMAQMAKQRMGQPGWAPQISPYLGVQRAPTNTFGTPANPLTSGYNPVNPLTSGYNPVNPLTAGYSPLGRYLPNFSLNQYI